MKTKKENSKVVGENKNSADKILMDQNEQDIIGSEMNTLHKNKLSGDKFHPRENSYYELFNTVTEAIYIQKTDGTFLDVNNGAVKMYGYSHEELVGLNPEFVSAPGKNDLAMIGNIILRVAKTGNSEQFEFWGRRKNGEIFPKEVFCNKGKYFGEDVIISTARDITDRKQAEDAIKDKEEKYRMLLELAADAFFQGDADGNFITVNNKAIDLTGYSKDELLKMNISDLFTKEILNKNALRYDLLKKGETIKTERIIKRKDGNLISVEMNSKLMPDGSYQSFFRDITERRQAEEELRKERTLLKTFVDNIPISVFIKDRESRKILSNPADQANTQKSEKEVLGKNDYELFSQGEAEGFIADDKYVMENDVILQGKEETILNKKDGSVKYVSTTKMPFKNETGEIIGVIGFSIDISERKKVEEALRESEKRFRTLFEHSPDAIILADIETGIVIDANSEASRLLARPVEEIRGMHQAELHPERANEYSKKTFRFQVNKLLQENEYHPVENFIVRSDGTEVPVEVMASMITISGKPVLQGVFRDITERKRAEEAVQESKARLKRGELVAKAGNWELHLDSKTMLASDGACKLYGYETVKELHLDEVQTIVLSEYRPLLDTALHNLIEKGEPYNVEFKIRRVGTNDILDINSIAEYDHEKRIVFGVIQDVTQRKRAEQIQKVLYNISGAVGSTDDIAEFMSYIQAELGTLLDTTNFYIAFYDEATDMLTSAYCKDENDDIESWSAKNSLTGYVVKNNKPLLLRNGDLFKQNWLQEFYQIGSNSEVWLGVPLREDGKATGAFVVQSYSDPNAYSEEDVEMLEFISDQISLSIHRKKAEQAILAAKEKAEESDRLKTAFLANMSHEIRTPMNGILGFAELLDDETLSQERRSEFTSVISNSSKQLLTVINDIIDISKIESGQLVISNVHFNLNKLMGELLTAFENQKSSAGKSHIKLIFEKGFADEESDIYCDDMRLSQVMNNLIGNALKFTSSGFVKFGYRRQNEDLLFYVQDTGKGIAADKQQFVFERFRQAEESNTRRFGGTGLGLSISKGLVELLGGNIWLVSEEDKGSTFYFSIPVNIQPQAETAGNGKKPVKMENGFSEKTILIAEDIQSNFDMIRIMLEKTNAVLLYAEDGAQALDICCKHDNIDLVLMDIQMPVMNGYDATREIRKVRPQLPIIALTAFAYEEDKVRCFDAGCNDFIAKPIDRYELVALMSKFLIK